MSVRFVAEPDGRAVTPAFRVFGGIGGEVPADAVLRSDCPAMHRGEWLAFGLLIPWVLGVAVFDGLWRLGGPWLAWTAAGPGLWFLLHALAFVFGVSRPLAGWICWSVPLTLWSVWALGEEPPVVRVTAGMWWAMLGLQVLGLPGLGWRRAMRVSGWAGASLRLGLLFAAHAFAAWLWVGAGWPAGLAAGLACAAYWAWVTFRPRSGGFGPVLTRSAEGRVLTIDDGPDPEDTPRLLDLLDLHDRKAVFFVIGDQVRRFPELAREIARRGHELGNHTMTHPQASMWGLGPWRTRREIVDCQRAIEEVTGTSPRWFRAPVGHRNLFTHPFAAELGLEVVAWTRRGFDTVERDLGKILAALYTDPRPDDVLLLHEGTPVAVDLLARVLEREAALAAGKGDDSATRRDEGVHFPADPC